MAFATPRVEPPEVAIGHGRRLLDEEGGVDELAVRAQAADREILERARSLNAVPGLGRDLMLALANRARCASRQELYFSHACRIFRQCCGPDRQDLDGSSARCTVGDEDGDGARDRRNAVRSGADDHRAEHRSGLRHRGRHLPGHRHAHLRGEDAGWRQPDRAEAADQAMPLPRPPSAASCVRTRWIRSPATTPATTSVRAHRSFTSSSGRSDDIEVKLILKGGGCENMNAQYSLPTELPHLGRADRSLAGVRKCILHAVWNAQGKGCAPGAIGVAIGGDRTSGYVGAKEQLFRTLDDVNPDPRLAELEASIMGEVNNLGIGTMGFGGKTSLIGCKVGVVQSSARQFFRFSRLRLLGIPSSRCGARRQDRSDQGLAVSRRGRADHHHVRPGWLPAHGPGGASRSANLRGRDSRAESWRHRPDFRPRVHGPRCGPPSPDVARTAGRPSRRCHLSLRAGRCEGRATAGG